LRTAIVLRQRHQHRAALVFTFGVAEPAAAQPLEVAGDLVEIGAHLLDARIDRAALGRLAGKQREKARAVAALTLGLILNPLQFGLLPALGFGIALNLFRLGAVAAATVNGRQLADQPLADRIGSGLAAGRRGKALLRGRAISHHRSAHERHAGKGPSQEQGIRQAVTIPHDLTATRPTEAHILASGGKVTSIQGRR